MKLLVDYHHADLFESHQLVFGDRFGWQVCAPYGMAWFDQWFWSFERSAHGDAIARQYLVDIWGDAEPDANGLVHLPDRRHAGRTIVGITLDAARETHWDLVMSSVPDNAHGFRTLARACGARFFVHIGNQWGDEAWEEHPDGAIVTTTSPVPASVPHVVVHQEFRRDVFHYAPPEGFGPVASFVNCFPETPEYQGFLALARQTTDFDWAVYGAIGMVGAPDEFTRGDIVGVERLAEAQRASGAIWHAKHWSDGFGHVVHNAFAVGRPVVGYERYYRDKLAGPLWVDGVTSIDVDRHEPVAELRRLRDNPDAHRAMCEAAARRFDEIVSFDEDAARIAELVGARLAVAA